MNFCYLWAAASYAANENSPVANKKIAASREFFIFSVKKHNDYHQQYTVFSLFFSHFLFKLPIHSTTYAVTGWTQVIGLLMATWGTLELYTYEILTTLLKNRNSPPWCLQEVTVRFLTASETSAVQTELSLYRYFKRLWKSCPKCQCELDILISVKSKSRCLAYSNKNAWIV